MAQDEPLDPRRVLLLAVAVTEWKGALDHLVALQKMGLLSERRRPTSIGIVRREMKEWVDQWPRVTSPVLTDEQVIEEARLYLTKHENELMELIEQESDGNEGDDE